MCLCYYRRPESLQFSLRVTGITVKCIIRISPFLILFTDSILIIFYLLCWIFFLLVAPFNILVVFKHQCVDLSHWEGFCVVPGESFMESSVAASEHLKKSPLSPNSMGLTPGLRSPSKLLHHNNSTGRKRH